MPTQKVDYPQFWRFRVEEVRRIADDMKVVEEKAIMTRIAADFERIANLVEQRLRGRKQRLSVDEPAGGQQTRIKREGCLRGIIRQPSPYALIN